MRLKRTNTETFQCKQERGGCGPFPWPMGADFGLLKFSFWDGFKQAHEMICVNSS